MKNILIVLMLVIGVIMAAGLAASDSVHEAAGFEPRLKWPNDVLYEGKKLGGILSEAMALRGAAVTGTDMGEAPLGVARLHALEAGVELEYRHTTAEALAEEAPGRFDVVTCMELLEHVPDPASTVRACARLVRPDGHVFFSTINRNAKSYLLAIVGAEYILGMLPKGTHDYEKFIRPAELEGWMRRAELALDDLTGMSYNPLTRRFSLGRDVDVNYLAHGRRPEDGSAGPSETVPDGSTPR